MSRLSLLTCLVLAVIYVTPTISAPVQQFNGNLFVDGILIALHTVYSAKLDSLDLPERKVRWSENVGLFNLTGEAKLYNGFLHGFKTIHRTGDAHIRYLNNKKTSIVCKLGAGPLGISYTGKISMFGVGPRLMTKGQISYVNLDLTLLFDEKTRQMKVLEVDMTEMGKVDMKIDSPGFIVDKITNLFLRATLRVIQPAVKYAIRYTIRRMLTDAVRTIPVIGKGGIPVRDDNSWKGGDDKL